MWIARDKEGYLFGFNHKPVRTNYNETGYYGWIIDTNNIPLNDVISIQVQMSHIMLPKELFPNLTWDDEPIEVGLIELNSTNEEPIDDTIVLTRYYKDYEKEHEWFVNMLKRQERYKDCTDEEIEEIWKDHITETYTFDEIWSTIQCESYTKIILRMGRHDIQPDYDYVLETKEYIDKKMKKHL